MATLSETIDDYKLAREHCGYFPLEDWALVSAAGEDTLAYLQTQTTNDVLSLNIGQGQNNAVTDRKGRLLASFSLHRIGQDAVLLLVEKEQRKNLIECLEQYHFKEKMLFQTEVPQDFLLALQGPKSPVLMESLFEDFLPPQGLNDVKEIMFQGETGFILNKTLTGEEGYILAFPDALKEQILLRLREVGDKWNLREISGKTREILRVESGIPVYGRDMDQKHILPETGLEHNSVSYSKGCFIGQEVIARIKTYGSPAFALMGVVLENGALPALNTEIRLESRKIGVIKSAVFSPSLKKNIALAYIQKDFRSPDQVLEVTLNDQPCQIKTVLLPFYQTQSRSERATQLHRQALSIYKKEEDLDKPISLLREAIALDPKFANGYEALGVFLSKQNKLDEAISLMKRLAEIDPSEIMAHTNLSIYYMKQGRIEDAELEKGEATALQFEKMIEVSQAKKSNKAEAERKKQEQLNKLEMFKKVIEIDPDDEVANFGVGSIYLETGQYEEALPPLKTVIGNNKNYSAAYHLLGNVYEKLSRNEEAVEIYRQGIAAASKKGDLMPLNKMQTRMNQILHTES